MFKYHTIVRMGGRGHDKLFHTYASKDLDYFRKINPKYATGKYKFNILNECSLIKIYFYYQCIWVFWIYSR